MNYILSNTDTENQKHIEKAACEGCTTTLKYSLVCGQLDNRLSNFLGINIGHPQQCFLGKHSLDTIYAQQYG